MHLHLYYVHACFLQCLPMAVLAVSTGSLGNLDNLHPFFSCVSNAICHQLG